METAFGTRERSNLHDGIRVENLDHPPVFRCKIVLALKLVRCGACREHLLRQDIVLDGKSKVINGLVKFVQVEVAQASVRNRYIFASLFFLLCMVVSRKNHHDDNGLTIIFT